MRRPRLMIADDHALVVEGLRKLLERVFDLVGVVDDGRTLLTEAQAHRPDVILLDISMPGLNGLDVARKLRTLIPESRVIFVTMHADRTYAAEALAAGGAAYVVKHSAASELLLAIRAALAGKTYVSRMLRPRDEESTPGRERKLASPITARQREVLQLVAEGRTGKEIAALLRISAKTVEFHKARIAERLDLHSAAEFTRYAIAHHLIGP